MQDAESPEVKEPFAPIEEKEAPQQPASEVAQSFNLQDAPMTQVDEPGKKTAEFPQQTSNSDDNADVDMEDSDKKQTKSCNLH